MAEHSFTVTVATGEGGINIQVGGISPFEGEDGPGLEVAKALRLTMVHNTNRLAACIASAQHQHIHPETKSVH